MPTPPSAGKDPVLLPKQPAIPSGSQSGTLLTYHLLDHLGSVTISTDTKGAVTELSDYFPYGSIRADETSSPQGSKEQRKYIGQEFDASTGLSYLNARYYDGNRGQFLSQDPVFNEDPNEQNLLNPQSLNSYSYANGNPIVNKDPNGRCVDGVSTIACIGAWSLLSAIVTGHSLMLYGAITDNPEAIEAGFALNDIGVIGGAGAGQAKGMTNPITGQKNLNSAVGDTVPRAGKATGAVKVTNWGNPATLGNHFKDHGAQFGIKNADDYARKATDFYSSAQKDGYQRIVGSDGTTRIYDPKANTFGSYNPDGSTKTFFKPDNGQKYWNNQVNDTKKNVEVNKKKGNKR